MGLRGGGAGMGKVRGKEWGWMGGKGKGLRRLELRLRLNEHISRRLASILKLCISESLSEQVAARELDERRGSSAKNL